MEPILRPESNRPQFQQYEQPANAPQQAPTPAPRKRLARLIKVVKKYWYAFLILSVLIVSGIVFALVRFNQENSWQKATDYYAKADYAKAEKEIGGMGVPENADRLRIYAQTMLATRNFDKALPAYEKLYNLKKDPSDQLMLGNVYNEKKDYKKAIEVYTDVVTKNPSNIQAYTNIATLYKLQGNSEEAVKIAKKCVDQNKNNIQCAELLVGMLMENKNSEDYKTAVENLRKLNPNDLLFQQD